MKVSILLVESNVNHQAMYKIMLGKALNCQVYVVSNELEAVLLLTKTIPNLIIIGGSIATESTKDLIKYIKTLPKNVNVPVIKITSSLNKNDLQDYIRLGISDIIISYEFNINIFIKKVQKALVRTPISPKIIQSSPKPKYYEISENINPALLNKKEQIVSKKSNSNDDKKELLELSNPSEEENKDKTVKKGVKKESEKPIKPQQATESEQNLQKLKEMKPIITEAILEKKLSKVATINALPFIISELLSLTSSVNTDIKDLSRVIETDYALTARVLKLSNSAFYKRSGTRVLNLKDAIRQVGFYGLRDLALAVGAIKTLDENSDGSDLDRVKLWHFSFTRAVLAKELASLIKHELPESCFVQCLLSDIGIAILKDNFKNEFNTVLETCQKFKLPLLMIEKRLLGFTHNEISAKVLKIWNFPTNLIVPISQSHLQYTEIIDLDSTFNKYKKDILIMKLSDSLARILCGGLLKSELIEEIPEEVFNNPYIKITQEEIVENITEIKNIAKELMQIMLLHLDPELVMECDAFDKFRSYNTNKCMLIQTKPKVIPVMEVILKELNYQVKHIKNKFYEQEIIKSEKPDTVIFDIDSTSVETYDTNYIHKLLKDARAQKKCVFGIITVENFINTYVEDLSSSEHFVFLKKPFVLSEVCNFLDNLHKKLR